MTVVLEEPTIVQDQADSSSKDFGAEDKRKEARPEPLLYHPKPGVHQTPAQKRSPYWQPVDEQS